MSKLLRRPLRWITLALLLLGTKAPLALAEDTPKTSVFGFGDERLYSVLVALAKFDSKLKVISSSSFSIENDDMTISVNADQPVFYDGTPYQSATLQSGLYGRVKVSDKFYGVEIVLHYSLFRNKVPYGNVPVQERITVLYEDLPRFMPLRPRVFDSKSFAVNNEGTFQDTQTLGRFDRPLPGKTLQVLKQELILDDCLVATIYIARTPKEIMVIGYSVPPLIPGL